ncbi:MAG: hypothetical protein L6Q38_18055 [Nitrospira sp.]|nr:hypothetical protein [Nitrospira sp.]
MFSEKDLIHSYTRAQAIEDGVLVDVSQAAKEAGIQFPTVLTHAAWERAVTVPKDYQGPQSESGRLWDVLWMARAAIIGSPGNPDLIHYDVSVTNLATGQQEDIRIKAHCGPGDDAEPVITIMLPEED